MDMGYPCAQWRGLDVSKIRLFELGLLLMVPVSADNGGILDAQWLNGGNFHPILAAPRVAFSGWREGL